MNVLETEKSPRKMGKDDEELSMGKQFPWHTEVRHNPEIIRILLVGYGTHDTG